MFGLRIEDIIVNLIVLLVAMTLHEFAHNYVGHVMGDPVPKKQGRLTLNPFVHIHWVGWIMFAIIGFGILGSAPIASYRMRNPRWGFLAAVVAGPLANLGLAIIFAIVFRVVASANITLPEIGYLFLFRMVILNVLLFVFNLIPLFPLDGWHIVLSLLPGNLAYTWQQYRMQSYYAFIGLIIVSLGISYLGISGIPNPLQLLISQPTNAIGTMLLGI